MRIAKNVSTAIVISGVLDVSALVLVDFNDSWREAFLKENCITSGDFSVKPNVGKKSVGCARGWTELGVILAETFHCQHLQVELVTWSHLGDKNVTLARPHLCFCVQSCLLSLGDPFHLTCVDVVVLIHRVEISSFFAVLVLPGALHFQAVRERVKLVAFFIALLKLVLE